MKRHIKPDRLTWELLVGRAVKEQPVIELRVAEIISRVRRDGDKALYELTEQLDTVSLSSLFLSRDFLDNSISYPGESLKEAIDVAINNIYQFHYAQKCDDVFCETTEGVKCSLKRVPLKRVGIYIPGGSAPLFSTILMLAVPAKIAGCSEVVLFTPPGKDGFVDPIIAYTAKRLGITEIVTVGGAQAIAAMAYGTETIRRVDKIFGPGNSYVTTAKEMVSRNVAIDLVAGPSELMVIADSACDPDFVAADLLSQAEHGADSQVILLTDNAKTADLVMESLGNQLNSLERKDIARQSLDMSSIIVFDSESEIIEFANLYAPEHLIISTGLPWIIASQINAAGSIFIGNYSPESAGDYASGTNHTLPTGGWAKSTGGVTLDSFMHTITIQEISPMGLLNLGPSISLMAEMEQLQGHKRAVDIRLQKLKSKNL